MYSIGRTKAQRLSEVWGVRGRVVVRVDVNMNTLSKGSRNKHRMEKTFEAVD